jgi:hypothetical protein
VPGVVNSAKATAALVIEDLKADFQIRDRETGAIHGQLTTN